MSDATDLTPSPEARLLQAEFCAALSSLNDEFRLGSLSSILRVDHGISVSLRCVNDLLNLTQDQAQVARRILSRAPSGRPDPSTVFRLVCADSGSR